MCYVTLTERHASGITILTWVSSANVKAKLEILLGIGWIKNSEKCAVLGCRALLFGGKYGAMVV